MTAGRSKRFRFVILPKNGGYRCPRLPCPILGHGPRPYCRPVNNTTRPAAVGPVPRAVRSVKRVTRTTVTKYNCYSPDVMMSWLHSPSPENQFPGYHYHYRRPGNPCAFWSKSLCRLSVRDVPFFLIRYYSRVRVQSTATLCSTRTTTTMTSASSDCLASCCHQPRQNVV